MKCPKCEKPGVRVTDSRQSEETVVRRRRKCHECGYTFTTYEITAVEKAKYTQIDNQNKKMKNRIRALAKAFG